MTQMTRGFNLLSQRISSFLAANMPAVIDAVVADPLWSLQSWQLPKPVKYDAVDAFQVTDYPAICIDSADDKNWQLMDITSDAATEFRVSYGVRLAVVAATPRNLTGSLEAPHYDTARRVMKDLTTITQNLLLQNPGLDLPTEVDLDIQSLNTSYLGTIKPTRVDKYVCASLLTFNMTQRQFTRNVKVGNANTITLTTQKLIP